MEIDEYIKKAKETDLGHQLEYYFLGLAEEAGEILGKRKRLLRGDFKYVYHPFEYDEMLMNEIGDLLWYITIICDKQGYNIKHILDKNVKKLEIRKKHNSIKGHGDNR